MTASVSSAGGESLGGARCSITLAMVFAYCGAEHICRDLSSRTSRMPLPSCSYSSASPAAQENTSSSGTPSTSDILAAGTGSPRRKDYSLERRFQFPFVHSHSSMASMMLSVSPPAKVSSSSPLLLGDDARAHGAELQYGEKGRDDLGAACPPRRARGAWSVPRRGCGLSRGSCPGRRRLCA